MSGTAGERPRPDDAARTRRRVVVHGQVHAVGFRASCARRAVEAGVAGWVRNIADQRVEAVFEGAPAAVEALVRWCHQGPRLARVSRVEVFSEPVEHVRGFAVR